MALWTKRDDGSTVWSKRASAVSAVSLSWTTDTRPENPYITQMGTNIDFSGSEVWNGTKWVILSGLWTTATRPDTTDIAKGSKGFNMDEGYGIELWDGDNWRLL